MPHITNTTHNKDLASPKSAPIRKMAPLQPPLVLTTERQCDTDGGNPPNANNTTKTTVSSSIEKQVNSAEEKPFTTTSSSVSPKIIAVQGSITNGVGKSENTLKSRLISTAQQGDTVQPVDAKKSTKSTKSGLTKSTSKNKISSTITNDNGDASTTKKSIKKSASKTDTTIAKNPSKISSTTETSSSKKLTNALGSFETTKTQSQTNSTSTNTETNQINGNTVIYTTKKSLSLTKTQTINTQSPVNVSVKQATSCHIKSANEKPIDNSKFLERVLEAMRSSKPQSSTGLLKPSTFVLSSKTNTTNSSSPSTANGPFSPPPTTNDGDYPNPLSNGGGSTSSLSSNASVSTNASSRPPVPPQSQQRARKQVDSLSKQRERSGNTSSSVSSSTTVGRSLRRAQQNYDSEDGLILPDVKNQAPTYQYRHVKSFVNTTTTKTSAGNSYSTKSHISNGYGSSGISSSVSSASSSLSSRISGNDNNIPTSANETAVEVSLKLPLPKSDFLSTTGSSGNAIRSSTTERLRTISQRSPSPALSTSSRCSSLSTSNATNFTTSRSTPSRLTTPPRRVFPQTYTRGDPLDVYQMHNLEQSPVVFDANLSFVLGCNKQPVHQSVRPSPSYEDPRTTSAYLSEKIQNFLRRTDHVQEEWTALGKRSRRVGSVGPPGSVAGSLDSGRTTPTNSVYDDFDTISLIERQRERNSMERSSSVGRTRSSQNILTKAFQLAKTLPHTPTSRSNSMAREFSETDEDRTIQEEDDNDMDELSEMAVDLGEERSTANIATERLEAETAERLKLEKELNEQQNKVKNLQETSEKLEMELICAKSDLNGVSEDEDPENDEGGGSGVYKLKYERVARELEFTKRRLQTQHEHDLEQLVGLKKQLEKKLSDAYEEVEEQRQVVGQWKRKAQKMTNEMNDLRMLLEEQNGRNNLLEKKQRKFDAECQALQDAARQERVTKDRLSREKDVLIAEKFTLEQTLADTRLELELKEEKLASLQRELEEMTFGGSTEEEIAQLRRSKNELDRRVKEQEEELDEMAGQVQLLEQAKLRLEMSLETMRKEARREAQQRDDELEEARNSSYKKIKALECQLETEHEERTLLLREKHELERRLSSMEDQDRMDRQAEEAATQKLKRDLRKYKALLKDAQAQLERSKAETPGKALIRQLRNQLEDAESARTLVMKARQSAEAELAEVQAMFEESQKGRNDAEERANVAHRDRAELQAQIEENEEELAELMKKYSAAVKQLNTEQIAASEYEFKLSELEAERNNLKETVSELQQRLEVVENMADPSTAMLSKRLELRTKELESRLDLEQATRTRLETQVARLKETLEKVQNDVAQAKSREMQAQDALKKSQKSLRDMREEYHVAAGREQESVAKRKDLEKKLEQVESESSALKNDLRLALQRIADLQQAMEEGDDDVSDSDDSRSTDGSLSDLEERLRPIKVKRTTNGELMSPSSTKTLVHEKDDNSPRITLTSPSSPHIHKLARQAIAEDAAKAEDKVATATTTTANSISRQPGGAGLKNGEA
ncbi:golgin subfamily A member 4 isoform X4 [Ceratitis capitata]|uniref:golgin subfamily A member 4 isoform X4 n=2 Tax=Ceratitis capitata TaxID=7213 RepID=UPI0006188B05|nr:golgin subfamily A member 4 isoform X4 [Ceratitis capitata]XP_012156488.1 golgin subfamily A member 4 isoform X4 [Ceratitis capitata]XP_012156489.1 golgin subfamily A member 4 isoform X4 [Ceratitis capitata]XP_012156490.1 golgin subfamily A member 4 isoform X4 [Ceratitis capitata]